MATLTGRYLQSASRHDDGLDRIHLSDSPRTDTVRSNGPNGVVPFKDNTLIAGEGFQSNLMNGCLVSLAILLGKDHKTYLRNKSCFSYQKVIEFWPSNRSLAGNRILNAHKESVIETVLLGVIWTGHPVQSHKSPNWISTLARIQFLICRIDDKPWLSFPIHDDGRITTLGNWNEFIRR